MVLAMYRRMAVFTARSSCFPSYGNDLAESIVSKQGGTITSIKE